MAADWLVEDRFFLFLPISFFTSKMKLVMRKVKKKLVRNPVFLYEFSVSF